MAITFEPQIVEMWLTPHFKCITLPFSENDELVPHPTKFLMTSALFTPKLGKWRHVTSRRQIFIKIAENVSLMDIMFVSKYEVICII